MTKLYDVVGVSAVRKGSPLKFRLANGKPARRARILERNGHDGIFLIALDAPMTKEDAIRAFKEQHVQFGTVEAVQPKAQPRAEKVKATVTKATAKAKADVGASQLSPAALKALAAVNKKVA